MQVNEAFLDQLIKNHYKASQEMFFAAGFQLALAVAAFVFLPINIEIVKALGSGVFGGLFIIPTKESLDRREKARSLESFRPLLQALNQESDSVDETEKQHIKQLFLTLIDKTISS